MATQVYTGKKLVSKKDMFAKVSQCVAVGTIDEKIKIGGLAHIHSNTDYNKVLDDLFNELIKEDALVKKVYVVGGLMHLSKILKK